MIGDGEVLGGLRHPTMHPMQPLRNGIGLCHVRTQVAMDEPPAQLAAPLPHLTESVLGYLEVVSRETPVIYAVIEDDEQAAGGWQAGRLQLGPLHSRCLLRRSLFRRRETTAVDLALRWLGAPRCHALGLADDRDWEPT